MSPAEDMENSGTGAVKPAGRQNIGCGAILTVTLTVLGIVIIIGNVWSENRK
jgi:hypothetical protein